MNKISREQFEFYKQKHYELWDWLSKHPDGTKWDWFDSVCPERLEAENNCFACEITRIIDGADEGFCGCCPITDFELMDCCDGLYSLYTKFWYDKEKRTYFAEQIRDLPWDKNNVLDYVED